MYRSFIRSSSCGADQLAPPRSIPADFTETQGRYLAFIHAYSKIHRRAPAEADIQRFFEVTPPTVHRMVLELEKRGLIRREPGKARSIEVLVLPEVLHPSDSLRQPIKIPVSRY